MEALKEAEGTTSRGLEQTACPESRVGEKKCVCWRPPRHKVNVLKQGNAVMEANASQSKRHACVVSRGEEEQRGQRLESDSTVRCGHEQDAWVQHVQPLERVGERSRHSEGAVRRRC